MVHTLDIKDYLQEDEKSGLTVLADRMNIYLEDENFKNETATLVGDSVECLGNFKCGFIKNELPEVFFSFNFNLQFTFYYSKYVKVVKAIKEPEPKVYQMFTLEKGEKLIDTSLSVKSLNKAKAWLELLNQGKLTGNIRYSELVSIFLSNFTSNGVGVPVTGFIVEMVVSEICRNTDDFSQPYRLVAGKTGEEIGYHQAKLRELARLNSVFAGISFEDMNQSLKAAIRMSKNGSHQNKSPYESVIKY